MINIVIFKIYTNEHIDEDSIEAHRSKCPESQIQSHRCPNSTGKSSLLHSELASRPFEQPRTGHFSSQQGWYMPGLLQERSEERDRHELAQL